MSSSNSESKAWRAVLWVGVFFVLAASFSTGLSRSATDDSLQSLPDQVEYLTLARNLLHGQGLSFIDPRFAQRVYAFRTPGYPLFLAALDANVRLIRAVQALLNAATVLAVYLLAKRVMPGRGRRAAAIAALVISVNPMLIYFSGLILSETLFVAMLYWGMVLLLAGFGTSERSGRVLVWLHGAMLLATSVLVRPSAAIMPVLLGIGGLFVNQTPHPAYQSSPTPAVLGRWPLPIGTTMLLLIGVVLTPWALRNYQVLHHLVWTDTNSGITLFDGYNPDATGASNQDFVRKMPQLRLMDELGRSQYLTLRAVAFIRANPSRVALLGLAKAARTWSPMPLSDSFGSTRNRVIALCYSIPFDLLVLAGLWLGNLPRRAKAFLLLPAIYLTLIHALTVGSLRYRLPAEPALAVLGASLFYDPSSKWKRADSRDEAFEPDAASA